MRNTVASPTPQKKEQKFRSFAVTILLFLKNLNCLFLGGYNNGPTNQIDRAKFHPDSPEPRTEKMMRFDSATLNNIH